jgi:hypothetical protein
VIYLWRILAFYHLKNIISTHTKDFSEKKLPNLQDFWKKIKIIAQVLLVGKI